MSEILLHLKDIYEAKSCSKEQLIVTTNELTYADCEHYEQIGWEHYREEDLTTISLPELSPSIHFGERHSIHKGIVVEIKNQRYKVILVEDYNEKPYECKNKSIILIPTEEPLAKPDKKLDRRYGTNFFGQPTWVQNSHYPADLNGNPCYHLVTVENGWGDCGNYNILIGFDGDKPNVAYFEASCC